LWGGTAGRLIGGVRIVSLRMQTNPENKAEFEAVSNERYGWISGSTLDFISQRLTSKLHIQGVCGFRLREHASPFLLRQFHQLGNICTFTNHERGDRARACI
jgi:hypothetical protein